MSWLLKTLNLSTSDETTTAGNTTSGEAAGVKEDLSAISESIGRQFRSVAASFLSPPTGEQNDDEQQEGSSGSSSRVHAMDGIRSDLEEIKGTFKSSLSLFSSNSNKAVSQFSKLASNLLHFDDDDGGVAVGDHVDGGGGSKRVVSVDEGEDEDDESDDGEEYDDDEAVGVTDEIVEFASKIAKRPELWTDFPLSLDHEFDMSDTQTEHASVIEQLVPSFADLKSRLSSNLSEKQFWKIYFILLLPRLNEDEVELLSTHEIVEAREMLLQMLRSKKDTEVDSEIPESNDSPVMDRKADDIILEGSQSSENVIKSDSDQQRNEFDEAKKLEREEEGTKLTSNEAATDADNANVQHGNQKLGNEEPATGTSASSKPLQSEDEVSFSDLEDDDNDAPRRRSVSGAAQSTGGSSPEGSSEWVQLNKNGGSRSSQQKDKSSSQERDSEEEANDWLTIDEFDS